MGETSKMKDEMRGCMPLISIGVPWNEISVRRGTLIDATWNSYRLSLLYAIEVREHEN